MFLTDINISHVYTWKHTYVYIYIYRYVQRCSPRLIDYWQFLFPHIILANQSTENKYPFVALFLIFITISKPYMTATILFSFNTTMIVSTVGKGEWWSKTLREYIVLNGYIKFGIEKTYYLRNAWATSTFHG